MKKVVDQKKFMEKLYNEYHDTLLSMIKSGVEYTRTVRNRVKDERVDYLKETTFYLYSKYHCAKRVVTDYLKPQQQFEYLIFENGDGSFCKVWTDNEMLGNKKFKRYHFTLLKDGKVKLKTLRGAEFDILRDKERNLIMRAQECYEIMEKCQYAEL